MTDIFKQLYNKRSTKFERFTRANRTRCLKTPVVLANLFLELTNWLLCLAHIFKTDSTSPSLQAPV